MKQSFVTSRPRGGKPALFVALLFAIAAVASCGSGGDGYGTGPGNGSGKELNSGDFGAGGTYQHTFSKAGTYHYHCIHHSPMTGTVVVNDATVETLVNVHIVSSTSAFPAATVKTGGKVVWTNDTGMVHTVTSN
jgi:plastocyanin